MYKFDINPSKQKFVITCSGFFKVDEAEKFVNDLQQKIKTINPASYDLVIDAREQKPSGKDVLPLQEKAMGIYLSTPFRSRRTVEFDSGLTKMQIQRLGQTELLQKFQFVDSLEEAMK